MLLMVTRSSAFLLILSSGRPPPVMPKLEVEGVVPPRAQSSNQDFPAVNTQRFAGCSDIPSVH